MIGLLDDVSFSFTVTEASLVNCKDFEVLISQLLSKSTIGLCVRTITVNVEHHGLPVVFGRVPVRSEFDLVSELYHRQVQNVNLFKGDQMV